MPINSKWYWDWKYDEEDVSGLPVKSLFKLNWNEVEFEFPFWPEVKYQSNDEKRRATDCTEPWATNKWEDA